ncbi:hypothetical protein L227DRAFT_332197 [Lentinus tigrinus ALCF2SS1-6]|uniref:Uncharacterized protein n=1 Tax=Lentinus tigrinus ALCF2SS1-6 TaxID=1328759 RepID=A0A5C2RTN5_9APHY|nr:hypothetical protein L227DRAFT_332197 [Lentinus tigrinus ALCF2SS1-6]
MSPSARVRAPRRTLLKPRTAHVKRRDLSGSAGPEHSQVFEIAASLPAIRPHLAPPSTVNNGSMMSSISLAVGFRGCGPGSTT